MGRNNSHNFGIYKSQGRVGKKDIPNSQVDFTGAHSILFYFIISKLLSQS